MRARRLRPTIRPRAARPWIVGLTAALFWAAVPAATETAVANGDTRTIHLYHAHSHETISATFKVDGQYDASVLAQLNHFLRDWRNDDQISMDPRLFDVVWEVYRESGSQQPIEVLSAYRSPATNAMLRHRTRGVAEHSQHILGRAMDQHYMDVPMSRIRELGMKLQRGGVGFYPTSGTPFVHLDVGGVRHWPRMSYDQLARLFPDGKTVHIPSNGQPLPGYEQARAELATRGDDSYPSIGEVKSKGFFAWLFGGGGDEEEDNEQAGVRGARGRGATRVASAAPAASLSSVPDSYGKNEKAPSVLPSLFASQPAQPAPQPRQVSSFRPAPAPQVASLQPAPEAQQRLATAMVAEAGTVPASAAAPVAELPVPAAVLNPSDPTRAPSAPFPPRRPVELAALGPEAPLPPSRPAALSRDPHDAVRPSTPGQTNPVAAALAGRLARLPDVITRGPLPTRAGPGSLALGYAPQADAGAARGPVAAAATAVVPLPVSRPPDLISAHLDRSNFRSLTRPAATDRTASRSALGAALPPVRAAARVDTGAFIPLPLARPSSFNSAAPGLAAGRFTAGKPTASTGFQPHTEVN